MSVVCHACFSVLSWAKSEKCCRRTSPENCERDPSATPDDLREAINTLEEIEPIARRVLGIAHPIAAVIQSELQKARGLLRAREAGKNVVFVRE